MFATIITDCCDPNAGGRQATRVASLLSVTPTIVGCQSGFATADLEAAVNLVDMLDASEGRPGVVVANVAPRNGDAKKWTNGSPFWRFYSGETCVIASAGGRTLSLVEKLGIATDMELLDISAIVEAMVGAGQLTPELASHIIGSQFRSYEFVCRLIGWVFNGTKFPTTRPPMKAIAVPAPGTVGLIDRPTGNVKAFGNVKTFALPEDIGHEEGKVIETKFGAVSCYRQLRDVPDGELGLTIGSSGAWVSDGKGGRVNRRLVELVLQGGSAAEYCGINVGDILF